MRRTSEPNVHDDGCSNKLPDDGAAFGRKRVSDVTASPLELTSSTTAMPFSSPLYDGTEEEDIDNMIASLGDGPMRFSPKPQGKYQQHCDSNDSSSASCSERSQISSREKKCCEHLKKQWESTNPEVPFSYEMYLRLQNEKRLIAANRGDEEPEYVPFGLSIEELEPQLLTEVRSYIYLQDIWKKGRHMVTPILTDRYS
jgi:hypothetical protein